MRITLDEEEFRQVLGEGQVRKILTESRENILGGNEKTPEEVVFDAIPKVLARKFRAIIPEDYTISEIELRVSLSGTPFGVGVSGEAVVRFGPTKK
jgi:hypothetical protein